MARLPTERTTALPYLLAWDGANADITDDDVNEAPMELPASQMADADMLVIYPACAEVGSIPQWQLLLADFSIDDSTPEPGFVIAALAAISSEAPTVRRSDADGGAGYYLHNPIQFDIRGLRASEGGSRTRRWFLTVAAMGGETTNVFLLDFTVIKRRPL